MPLYDPRRLPEVEPEDAIMVVHDFVERCRRFAEREIPRYADIAAAEMSPEAVAKLQSWISYVKFADHTLRELETGELDHWFSCNAAALNEQTH